MGGSTPDPDRLSVREVRDVFDQMDGVQWKRAERLAQLFAHGLAGMDADDLLNEVCTQLLAGQRRFPRGTPPLAVLKNAMHSEASNARKSAWATRRDDRQLTEPAPTTEDSDETLESRSVADGAISQITPEDELLAREQLDATMALATGDPTAEMVLMAWAEGMRGAEAMNATGLDAKTYDAARHRLLRKLSSVNAISEDP